MKPTFNQWRMGTLLMLPLIYPACGDSIKNNENMTMAGEPMAGGSTAGETMATTWTTEEIYEGLHPTCSPCHDANLSYPIFESLAQFERLIVANEAWVVAGAPDQSELLKILSGNYQGIYSQMPPSGDLYSSSIAGLNGAPSMQELREWIRGLDPIELGPETVECAEYPDRALMARLSRLEYRNAVRELFGSESDPGADFPSENESYGFSHISALLTLSPLLLEKYDLAAQALALQAIPLHSAPSQTIVLEEQTELTSTVGQATGSFWNLWANGLLSAFTTLPSTGQYQIDMFVGGGQAGPDPVRFALVVDGVDLETFETNAQHPAWSTLSFILELTAGEHQIGLRFLNDYYCPQDRFDLGQCSGLGDRNLLVDRVVITGPQSLTVPPSPFEQRYLTCDSLTLGTEACDREWISRFGRQVWRRPLNPTELDSLWGLASAEHSSREPSDFERRAGLRQVIHALLLSPHFIFRVERAPEGQWLNPFERAARLAAFLWRSIPDEQLLDAAEEGSLDQEEGLLAQVQRMINDPRASALIEDFGGRWMQLHHLDTAAPDYAVFPQFNEELRASMHGESIRTLKSSVAEGRSLLDLVNLDYTWVDGRLASFYGMEDAYQQASDTETELGFRRITLPQAGRQGFLTQGAWLTLTSHPTRTSPVVRGKWILENLLCSPPPPPPPSVEGLPESGVDQSASVRERLEQHRSDPACAACHTHMDAIGFGFEPFSGIGEFRLMDGAELIDPSGILPSEPAVAFNDTVGLVNALRADEALPRCVTERMIIYALGRGLSSDEHCFVDQVMSQAGELSLESLATAIAGSIMMNQQGVSR